MALDPIPIEPSVALLRVLANPARLRVALWLLEGERSVGEIETGLGIRQPALSQHLAELREAGLVATRRESRAIFYRLADDEQQRLVAALLQGFGGAISRQAGSAPQRPRAFAEAARFATVEMAP